MKLLVLCILVGIAGDAYADRSLRRADWGLEVSVPDDHVLAVDQATIEVTTPAKQKVFIAGKTKAEQDAAVKQLQTTAKNMNEKLEDLGTDKIDGFDRHRYRYGDRYEMQTLARGGRYFELTAFFTTAGERAATTVRLRPFAATPSAPGTIEPIYPKGWFFVGRDACYLRGEHVIWRSLDGGFSWEARELDVEGTNAVNTAVVGTELVMATYDVPPEPDGKIQGTHVSRLALSAPRRIFEDPQTISFGLAGDGIAAVGYLTDAHQLTLSTDGGATWKTTPIAKELAKTPINELHVDVADGAWYVSGPHTATYRSADGVAWTKVHNVMLEDVSAGSDLLAIADRTLLRSTDHGVTWKVVVKTDDRLAKVVQLGGRAYTFGRTRAKLLELRGAALVPAAGWKLDNVVNAWVSRDTLIVNTNNKLYRFVPPVDAEASVVRRVEQLLGGKADAPRLAFANGAVELDPKPVGHAGALAAPQVSLAIDERAAWVTAELGGAPATALVDAPDPWRPLVLHLGSFATKPLKADAARLPAAIARHVDPGADDAIKRFEATLADPKAFARSISERNDVVLLGSDRGERFVGGDKARAAVLTWNLVLAVRGGLQAGVTTSKSVAWIAGFVDGHRADRPKDVPTIYFVTAIYERHGTSWDIVQLQFSNIAP